LLACAGFTVGCGGDDKGAPAASAAHFTDTEGRQCSYEANTCDVQCDVAPDPSSACTGSNVACFTITPSFPGDAIQNCPACCSSADCSRLAAFSMADCVPITCQADSDCAPFDAQCVQGTCVGR
jgi:hypothetical protein